MSTAIDVGQWPWVPVVLVGSLLAGAYVFRVVGHAFGAGERIGGVVAWGREEIPALLLAVIATVVLGLGAAGLWDFLPSSGAAMGGTS